jgi:hypothetical protein
VICLATLCLDMRLNEKTLSIKVTL